MVSYTITDQDYKLLELIAAKEQFSGAPDPYTSLVPSTFEPQLVSMTLNQVLQFQAGRINQVGLSAAGRYQFVKQTLEGLINSTGLDRNLTFNKVVQDFLALTLAKSRGLAQWKTNSLSTPISTDADISFQIKLSQEWAAVPVPIPIPAGAFGKTPSENRNIGDSYYQGQAGNSAGFNADVFRRELTAIRQAGPGQSYTLDIATASRPYPPKGLSAEVQAMIASGGGQADYGGSSFPETYSSALPMTGTSGFGGGSTLPSADNPYLYQVMNPGVNRYDFRTGKKVKDLFVNGVAAPSSRALVDGNNRGPVADTGSPGYDAATTESLQKQNTSIGFGAGQVDPKLAKAAGIVDPNAPIPIGYGNGKVDPGFSKALPKAVPTAKTVTPGTSVTLRTREGDKVTPPLDTEVVEGQTSTADPFTVEANVKMITQPGTPTTNEFNPADYNVSLVTKSLDVNQARIANTKTGQVNTFMVGQSIGGQEITNINPTTKMVTLKDGSTIKPAAASSTPS